MHATETTTTPPLPRRASQCRRRLGRVALALWLLSVAIAARGFDGDRAMTSIREQCALGPRIPGTDAHRLGREWIAARIRELGMTVREEPFGVRLPLTRQRVQAVNLWGLPSADGPTSPAILLSAHWDTRPWADREQGNGRSATLVGANDGASGVAMALEVARNLRGSPLDGRLVLAFWDAEDSGVQNRLESWALGSKFSAANPPPWIDRVALGINLDMVAGEDLRMRRELHSLQSAPRAVDALWLLGAAMAPARFAQGEPIQIVDDHLSWIRVGLPYVNLIGYPYAHWHRAGDTPENCSADVMNQIGGVVEQYLLDGDWPAHGRVGAVAGRATLSPATSDAPATAGTALRTAH